MNTKSDKYGIRKKVVRVVPFYSNYSSSDIIPSKEMLKDDLQKDGEPCFKFFTCMYYRNKCLGYMVYEPKDYLTFEYSSFMLWAYNTSEKIGSFYLRKELELLNLRDHLTGLYNRRGMEKYFNKIYKEVLPKNEYITIICIDIDYLKRINDKFGHEGGDNAIVQIANAIETVFSKNGICVRTGGDEFCVVTHSAKKQNIDNQINKVTKILEDYNNKKIVNYPVMCSCGYYTLYSKDFTSFEEMQKIADQKLYEVKAMHHHPEVV